MTMLDESRTDAKRLLDRLVIWPFLCACGETATQHAGGLHECIACRARRLADEDFKQVLRERAETIGL